MSEPLSRSQLRFQHLRKTGGTTLQTMLGAMFPASESARFGEILSACPTIEEARAVARSKLFLHGHADLLELADASAFRFAFVRDPFARLCSERKQWSQAGEENIQATDRLTAAAMIVFKPLELKDILCFAFAHPPSVYAFWNHMTLALGAGPLLEAERGKRPVDHYDSSLFHLNFGSAVALRSWVLDNAEKLLATAVARLRTLNFVGIYEDFDSETHELFARLGLPRPDAIPRLNARSAYADEADPELRAAAKPFLALDQALYEEARAMRGRRQATTLTPRNDLGHLVRPGQELVIAAREAPCGHGWHSAHLRQDGRWSRWTSDCCSYLLSAEPGDYSFELRMFGAASERAIRELKLTFGQAKIGTTVGQDRDGLWFVRGSAGIDNAGAIRLRLEVPDAANGYGLEVAELRFGASAVGRA